MKCKEARTKLHFWIDNQLNKDEEQGLTKHLSACKNCNNFKEDLLIYKNLIINQNNLIPFNLDPIAINSKNERNQKKLFELAGLVAAACFGILIGMSLFQLSSFYNKKQEPIIAETPPSTPVQEKTFQHENVQNVNVIKNTYYQPMSFMIYYDDFFLTNETNQSQEYSAFPSE